MIFKVEKPNPVFFLNSNVYFQPTERKLWCSESEKGSITKWAISIEPVELNVRTVWIPSLLCSVGVKSFHLSSFEN